MALDEYQRKRDFAATPEPAGTRKRARRSEQTLQYCIQKHDATRLHYDFRLELDGTLKSWAIPKGRAWTRRCAGWRACRGSSAGLRQLRRAHTRRALRAPAT